MITLIPAPKTCLITDEALHSIPLTVHTEKEEWLIHLDAFRDAFERGFGLSLRTGEPGGIELCVDESLADDEYRLTSEGPLRIYASASEGLTYGLASALQLCKPQKDTIGIPAITVTDRPDKDYRALMVDLGREWHPFAKLLKFVDLCFFYKVRYLNLHFADNKLYTLPSKAFPKLCVEGKYYTEEQIATLRGYASARGVVLVPEFECPGHAPILNAHYPEIFGDRSEGEGGVFYNEAGEVISNDALLCASRESAVEGVKTLLKEVAELFPEAPYIHIGGDEASISLWDQCTDCRAYMKQHGIDGVYGLYSDYVARMARYVLSLGKIPMVWEGFPKEGSEKVPKETVVISWENHYQTTEELLESGFEIINASWKPLYIVPSMTAPLPKYSWNARSIFEWNVYNWQHWWPNSVATLNPVNVPPTEQVIGAMLCAWEMTYDQEITLIMANLAALAERTWTVKCTRTFEEYRKIFYHLFKLSARIIQDR